MTYHQQKKIVIATASFLQATVTWLFPVMMTTNRLTQLYQLLLTMATIIKIVPNLYKKRPYLQKVGTPKENLKANLKEGNFVQIVQWNGLEFPGLTMSVTDAGAIVECMERTKKCWKWPLVKDSLFYEWASITKIINPPRLMKRGLFHVSN